MAKWFVGPVMEKLMATCSEYLSDQLRWQAGMKEELERLQENLPKIQAVVAAASQVYIKDQNSSLNKWIWQLRDAIDEAEDVLDDFEYMKHEELVARNMARSTMGRIEKIAKRAFNVDSNLKRLREIVHKLDKILVEANTFLYLIKDKKQEQQVQQDKMQNDRETGSMPKVALVGRDQDKEYVIKWLGKLPNEEHQSHLLNIRNYNNISILSIVGPGGMGKTTLLQHVYEGISTNDFDLKMWVCVSNNFNVKKVFADMLETLKETRHLEMSFEALQNSLKSKVMSKKFLLVLDDIWEEDEERDKSKWETILAPLTYGGLGSKILLTTRMSSTALMIANVIKKKNEVLKFEGLKEDECLRLLNAYAFVNVENPNEHNKLRSIAGELVTKLYGSPLAAKVLGGVLNSKLDERHWRNVLNNVLSHNGIFSILELSYIFLPEYLQNCFAFCSIFAQDHIFDKDNLVQMWIAVGFIKPSRIRGETLEDIGERYFDMLVKKSFFDKFYKVYKMHDLLYELAQSVSTQECFRVVDDEDSERIPETIRHLSIETNNLQLLKKMRKFKNLRTLCITTYVSHNQYLFDALTKFFEESRSIRLLSIFLTGQEMIPEKIGCLKHLRYLGLNFSYVTLLPRSVSNLYHLQFLICKNSSSHDDLFPRDMNNLSNLRCLRMPHFKFPGIGKLKLLQELNKFEVKNESGYRIEELEHMNDLRILRIEGLENVMDVQEACNAKLCGKGKLTDLSLIWNAIKENNADLGISERVLDNLEPHNNMKKLTMKGYNGVRSAIWMNNANLINNLEDINLAGCLEWQILPPFGQLPFLKSLRLCYIPKAKRFDNIFHGNGMCCSFPSLEVLYIENLEALVNWFEEGVDCLFPCLTKLVLYNCPNLQELPYLPPKLKELKAMKIGWKTLNCCSILGLSGRFLQVSSSIRELHIKNLKSLQSLPSNFRSLSSLEILHLENIPLLKSLPDLPPSLRDLKLDDLESLNSLPSCLHSLYSLTDLYIWSVPQLRELPDLPTSLCKLYIGYLKNLNCLPSYFLTSSLISLTIFAVPRLRELPELPPSLCELYLSSILDLNCLPSCLSSLSSLTSLDILNVPRLQELPDLSASLCTLKLAYLKNLNCLSSSCLPSSLISLTISEFHQLQELHDLPHSLCELDLNNILDLNCLPSCLPSLSSLRSLSICQIPQLRELPDLPASLCTLTLKYLKNLNCLPSCLPSLSSLTYLKIDNVPLLRELPNLPPSMKDLIIWKCDPELMKRYKK